MLTFKHSARGIIADRMGALIAPPEKVTPSQWAAANLIVPDGPRANEKWDPSLTPYVVEPLDNTGPDSPVNKQSIKKSAQTGFTVMAIAIVGSSIDTDPSGGILLVQPTEGALDDFIQDKLNPAIESSAALKRKVRPQVARSGEGSTKYSKRYPGGSMSLAIANSTADLRSKTKRKIVKDEASEYPADLNGQGSPHAMIEARYESFLASGDWSETNISTPTVKGACYIDAEFHAGDQRYWHIVCPGCGAKFPFRFGEQFKFNETFPYQAHYVAKCCGTVIEGHEKNALVRSAAPMFGGQGGWIATAPAPGKPRSYHIDAMSSPFVPWDKIAERYVTAQSDPSKMKAFYNLTLGEAYEMKGDAPDHVRLMERRETYRKGHIPPRGLILTIGCDVQMRGIYVEVVAWAPNRESWVIYTDVLEGDTTNANAGAFLKLADLYNRQWPDAYGGARRCDAMGVDSGYRSHVIYDFCRTRHNAYALKGVDGWGRPALGTPTLVDIDLDGRKIGSTSVFPVGTWSLKGHFYEDLRREGLASGQDADPAGYCHFHRELDEIYFRQITSEYLAEKRSRGRMTRAWEVRGKEENHFLDCRVYNMALADHLGLSRMTADEWQILARERASGLLEQGSLFAPESIKVMQANVAKERPFDPVAAIASSIPIEPDAPAVAPTEERAEEQSPAQADWLGDRDLDNW